MTTIYLIRHAEAEGNLYRLAHGQYNSLITPRGYRQLAYLKKRFADIHIDKVYGSDLFRTHTTASAIFKPKHLTFHPLPLLREVNLGPWEEKTWAELERLDPEMLINFNKRPHLFQLKGAEDFATVRDRMMEGIFTIARECPAMTVAATSHGMATRILVGTLSGMSLEEIGHTRHGDNTSVCKLLVDGDKVTIEYQHDNSHLPPELSTISRQTWHKSALSSEPGLWYTVKEETADSRHLTAHLVEEEAGEVAFHKEGDTLRITEFFLKESVRGHRYGAALLGQAVQFARHLDLPSVSVVCSPEWVPYFKQFGFGEEHPTKGGVCLSLDIRYMMREIPEIKE